jgi:hypothetical protein
VPHFGESEAGTARRENATDKVSLASSEFEDGADERKSCAGQSQILRRDEDYDPDGVANGNQRSTMRVMA